MPLAKKKSSSKTKQVVVDVPIIKEKVIEEKVIVKKVKKRRMSLKTMLRLFFYFTFAVIFIAIGVYLSKEVMPVVEDWLVDHSFIEGRSEEGNTDPEQNSPFLQKEKENSDTQRKVSRGYTIPEIVEDVSASVVSITVSSSNLSKRGRPITQSTNTIGTGFIVESNGIIVTNQHVVSDVNATYRVVTHDNKVYTPKKIVRDAVNDIALIVLDAKDLPVIKLGDSDTIKVGETVIAIGTPLGDYPGSVTVGVISGLGRTVVTGDGFWALKKEYENVLQTDAAVNPGNSGGPLINLSGNVIGVNFATTGNADNLSFALPSNLVKQKLDEYKEFGEFKVPYLGVGYRMIDEKGATYYGIEPGALVRSVAIGSPAEKAGILVGDIITKVEDKDISASLTSSLGSHKVGDKVQLTLFRIDEKDEAVTLTVQVTLGEKPPKD